MKKYNFSYSFAKDIKQHGVKYAIDKKENRKESFNFGSAYHMYVLEPEKFNKTYATCEFNKNTKKFKEWLEETGLKKHNIITSEQLEQFKAMKESLMQNKEVKNILEHPQTETEITFEKKIGDDNFKGILDIHNSEFKCGYDLKTCSSVEPDALSYQIKIMLYDMQFYMYYNLGDLRKFKFIFQEDKYPYYTRVVELDDEWCSRGENFIHETYEKWLEYQTFGENTAKESIIIEMPGYIRYADETDYKKIEWNKADLPF
jgi:hypothetical protein